MRILRESEMSYIEDCLDNLPVFFSVMTAVYFVIFLGCLINYCQDNKGFGWMIFFFILSVIHGLLICITPEGSTWKYVRKEKQKEYLAEQREKNAQ